MSQLVAFNDTTGTSSGTLTTTGDTAVLPILGVRYATARFTATAAGTATATAEVSIDGGTNYIGSAYAKRVDAASANPTVQAISATTLTSAQVWEVPLPANATHFRLRCAGTGTVTAVLLSAGQVYVPGIPVLAVLYDVVSATNTTLDTGTLDFGGWSTASCSAAYSGATAGTFNPVEVDDAGASFNGVGEVSLSVTNTPLEVTWGVAPTAVQTVGGSQLLGMGMLSKRMRLTLAGTAAQTGRMRIQARR